MFCGTTRDERGETREKRRERSPSETRAIWLCLVVTAPMCGRVWSTAHIARPSQATVLFHILVAATGDCVGGEVPASVFNVASVISFCSHFHVAMGKTRSKRERERDSEAGRVPEQETAAELGWEAAKLTARMRCIAEGAACVAKPRCVGEFTGIYKN